MHYICFQAIYAVVWSCRRKSIIGIRYYDFQLAVLLQNAAKFGTWLVSSTKYSLC